MKYTLLLLLACVSSIGFAQSRENIIQKGIVSQTILEIDYSEGLNEEKTESEEYFNKNGDLIEIKEYNSKEEIKRWEKYTYTEDGRVKSELYLDKKGNQDKKIVYTYVDGLKTEKRYYDAKDRLIKKKRYLYEYR